MDFYGLITDALPLVVGFLTILTAGGGIGLWLGVLSSRQKQSQTRIERLETELDEIFTLLERSDDSRIERISVYLRPVRRRQSN